MEDLRMESAVDADLLDKIQVIEQGRHRDLLRELIDILYQQELKEEEYFSPEDLDEIEAGFEEIRRGESVSWEAFKRKHSL